MPTDVHADRLTDILDTTRRFVDEELLPLEDLLLADRFDELIPALDEKRAQVRKTFLEPLLRGEVRSCFGMTEPEHAASPASSIDATA